MLKFNQETLPPVDVQLIVAGITPGSGVGVKVEVVVSVRGGGGVGVGITPHIGSPQTLEVVN